MSFLASQPVVGVSMFLGFFSCLIQRIALCFKILFRSFFWFSWLGEGWPCPRLRLSIPIDSVLRSFIIVLIMMMIIIIVIIICLVVRALFFFFLFHRPFPSLFLYMES